MNEMMIQVIELNYDNYLMYKDDDAKLIKFCGNIIALFPDFFSRSLLSIKELRESKVGKSPETVEFIASVKVGHNQKYAEVLIKAIDVFYKLQDKESKVYKMFYN